MEDEITRDNYIGMARFIVSRTRVHLPWDEIESVAGLTYWKCKLQYDESKGTWPGYLHRAMKNNLIRAAIQERRCGVVGSRYWDKRGRKAENSSPLTLDSLEAWPSERPLAVQNKAAEKIWLHQVIDILRTALPKELFEAWYLYHVKDIDQGQAAQIVGISRQAFNVRVKKARERIEKFRNVLGRL
jgi:DNA-directed RNA polymerase specialized sigma24 family protein